jgi:hypothetical protein
MKMTRLARALLLLLFAALLLLPFLAAAAPATKEIRKEWAARPGLVVGLENLAGSVVLEGTAGSAVELVATLHAENSSDLDLLAIDESETGDVRLAGDFTGLTEAKVGTSSGDVALKMEKAPGMSLSCRTSSGDIDVDVAGTKVKTEQKLEVAVGGGGAPVRVRTSSGSIRIEGR